MKPELTIIPTLSIHPNQINIYNQVYWSAPKGSTAQKEIEFDEKNQVPENFKNTNRSANGKVSKIAKRKIEKAVDYLLLMSSPKKATAQTTGRHFKFKIAFVTLTLPSKQIHSDNEIKSKCLNSLLLELKQFYKVKNYVWRAEKQKNGNLHFHLIIDKFVPWSELRDRWNRIVNKLGYVDRYRDELKAWHEGGFKVRQDLLKRWDYKKQLKAYQAGKANDWNSPNSTDIHAVHKIVNIKAYLSKYMTKNENSSQPEPDKIDEKMKQTGRIWSCNYELSNIKGAQSEIDNCLDEELQRLESSGKVRIYRAAYFTVINVNFEQLPKLGAPELFSEFCHYLERTFGYSHQPFLAPAA